MGIGTEPLSNGHKLIRGKVLHEITHSFPISNKLDEDCKFAVESDIPNLTGEDMFDVPASSTALYTFKIMPKHAGQYLGFISFTEAN